MNLNGKIIMEDGSEIAFELYEDVAPITVRNFVELANNKFYDGLTFHRVIPGFVIQGGCPVGNGTGGPGHNIKGEFRSNGVINNIKHTEGVLSMARAQHPDSAGSQFFIVVGNATFLDGQYAAFGKVTSNYEKCLKIANAVSDSNDKPLEKIVIKSIRVD